MLVEQRIYTTHPGQWRSFMALYEAEGLDIQRRILGRLVGYYSCDIGEMNQLLHLWAYRDLNERAERRARLVADPAFLVYARKAMPMLQKQESRILLPAPFFQPTWQDVPASAAE